ncbi:MAG TPA: hypothetical protein VHB97_05275 [Polyangia bacterium]|nr:hypothetical protein [Polyangia bacterium]
MDVGGGTSTLVDDLLARGYSDVTLLDISATTIDAAVRRSLDELHGELGGVFEKIASATEVQETHWGSEQQFVYCYCLVAA